jgi:Uma2 family endonuclease
VPSRASSSGGSIDGPADAGLGGGWIGTEIDVEYTTHDVYRHDVAGWRRDRVPICPSGRPIHTRPDWVCEILAPSNQKRDLVDKIRTLRAAQVPQYWILSPQEKVLIVHRLAEDGFLVVLTASSGETVCAEPFQDTGLSVGILFGDAEEDE